MSYREMPAPTPEQEPAFPTTFPIHTEDEVYFLDDKPQLQEGVIIHYKHGLLAGSAANRFVLLKTIGNLHYTFHLSETWGESLWLELQNRGIRVRPNQP